MRFTRCKRNTLGECLGSSLLGLSLKFVVLAYAYLESLSGLRLSDVLNSDVDALWDDASVNSLVYNNTDSVSSNIEDSSGFTMVKLEGKTSLD